MEKETHTQIDTKLTSRQKKHYGNPHHVIITNTSIDLFKSPAKTRSLGKLPFAPLGQNKHFPSISLLCSINPFEFS